MEIDVSIEDVWHESSDWERNSFVRDFKEELMEIIKTPSDKSMDDVQKIFMIDFEPSLTDTMCIEKFVSILKKNGAQQIMNLLDSLNEK